LQALALALQQPGCAGRGGIDPTISIQRADRHRHLNKRSEFSCNSAGTFLIISCFIFAH
jgi:hypothetical protein